MGVSYYNQVVYGVPLSKCQNILKLEGVDTKSFIDYLYDNDDEILHNNNYMYEEDGWKNYMLGVLLKHKDAYDDDEIKWINEENFNLPENITPSANNRYHFVIERIFKEFKPKVYRSLCVS